VNAGLQKLSDQSLPKPPSSTGTTLVWLSTVVGGPGTITVTTVTYFAATASGENFLVTGVTTTIASGSSKTTTTARPLIPTNPADHSLLDRLKKALAENPADYAQGFLGTPGKLVGPPPPFDPAEVMQGIGSGIGWEIRPS
jgi:hypothetical protein